MKKILTILAAITLSLAACADQKQLIKSSELPALAQSFIQKYFNVADIAYIEKDREGVHFEYNVYLNDATEIEFDHQGNLQSVDCKRKAIPEGVVPETIAQYVALHLPNMFVVEYVVERRNLKVELNTEIELIFDLDGNFLRMD